MTATPRISFGTLLRRFRLAAGLTQAELAEQAGVSERAVNDLERDSRRLPRLDTARQLAEALALSREERAQLLAAARPDAPAPDSPSGGERAALLASRGLMDTATSTAPSPTASLSRASRLPMAHSPLVGRAHDIAAVGARLRNPGIRLLTLTGPGGIGKTRLALQVACELQPAFVDGVHVVDLETLTDPSLLMPAIAAALGISESPHQAPVARLSDALQARTLLLVLDNFEQVLGAASEISQLLVACPAMKMLITSRTVLHLALEWEYVVPPLEIPAGASPRSIRELQSCAAVALFVQRAQAVLHTFTLTDANAQTVAAICTRLEGIPLALELAAARIKLLSPVTLLVRLDQQLAVLTGGPQDAPQRQRTVRMTLDWSYQLLSRAQQVLFRRLAVFAGGCTLEAVEGICADADLESASILDLLAQLVDHSLVVVTENQGQARYRLLEPIRQYALERLQAHGEEDALRGQHLAWFLAFAEALEAKTWIMPFPAAMAALRPEADNFRSALAWSHRDTSGQTTLQLAGALTILWEVTDAIGEGRRVLRDALDRVPKTVRTSMRARALLAAGDLASLQTDPASARPLLDEALVIFREVDDARNVARTLSVVARVRQWAGDPMLFAAAREETLRRCRVLGDVRALYETLWLWGDYSLDQGDYAAARQELEECVTICRQLDDTVARSFPLISLARVACAEGAFAQARTYAEQGVALRQEALPWLLAIALISLAEVERCANHDDRAADLITQGLAIFRAQDDQAGIAWALHNLGHIALRAGARQRAAAVFAEALRTRRQQGYLNGIAAGLAGLAGVSGQTAEYEQAARLFGATEALLEHSRSVLAPADRLAYERTVATVRANMGASALDAAWASGRALSLEQAVAQALAIAAR